MLQAGGVQEAMTEAPPPAVSAVAGKLVVVPVAQFEPPTETEEGLLEHQVRKVPVIELWLVSITVAVMVRAPFGATVTELLAAPSTASVIDCTAQVVKGNGALAVLFMSAKMVVVPGILAVAKVCPGCNPLAELATGTVARLTTEVLTACHWKVPTVGVMSLPWLRAVAWYLKLWPFDKQGPGPNTGGV
jgi:hypothetical protein